MAELSQIKVDCSVWFSHDSGRGIDKEYAGLLHLLEYDYDPPSIPLFWFGVVDVACTPQEFGETGFLGPSEGVRVNLRLSDGRKGWARYTRGYARLGEDGNWCFRLPVIGQASLEIPISN